MVGQSSLEAMNNEITNLALVNRVLYDLLDDLEGRADLKQCLVQSVQNLGYRHVDLRHLLDVLKKDMQGKYNLKKKKKKARWIFLH
jgi:septum formation inhibitor-activating ATPase MinD